MDHTGRNVVVTGVGSGTGAAAARRFADRGANALVADVDEESASETVAAIEDDVGTAGAGTHTVDVSEADAVARVIETAVDRFGGLDVSHNAASLAATRPRTGLSAYVASTADVVGLTKRLARESAEDGVSAIRPVATDAPTLREFAAGALGVEAMRETIPPGRLRDPDDVAVAATFLASEDAETIAGTALEVDGGRTV